MYSPYEFREPMTGRKAQDFNVAYAVGKWWLERGKLAELTFRSEDWAEQKETVEYWRGFCEEEFGLDLK
jgi:hypothetical protein